MSKKRSRSELYPELAKEWSTKNGPDFDSDDLHSTNRVWWVCKEGHEWDTVLAQRLKPNPSGCPYCYGLKVLPADSLATKFPEISLELKDTSINAELINPGSQKKYEWTCQNGHSYEASPRQRTVKGKTCPVCESFGFLYPDQSQEWDYSKNQGTPFDYSAGSNQRVWWKCKKGHEWCVVIHSRRKNGCAQCTAELPGPRKPLSQAYPWMEGEWSPNNVKALDDPTIALSDVVLWRCDKGHEWETMLKSRKLKNPPGCPFCSGRRCESSDSLSTLYPSLAKQFVDAGNADDPSMVFPGSPKKYEWLCPNGHTYSASPRQLTQSHSGCPTCNSLGFKHSGLLEQWDFDKNQYDPFLISSGSNKKVYWKCELGHSWEATVNSRTSAGTGCNYCLGKLATPEHNFAQAHPERAKFWDYEKNPDSPTDLTPSSNKKRCFVCKAGHSFEAKLTNIHNGKWCPYCANKKVGYGNSLADTNPVLAKEWNAKKNKITPYDVTAGSNKKAWWTCSKGHEWESVISSRSNGNGCPYCVNRFAGYGNSLGDLYPEIAQEIDQIKNKLDPFSIPAGSLQSIWWLCPRGHSYKAPVGRRTYTGSGCRFCSSQTSLPEIRLYAELQSIFPLAKTREKVEGREVDVLISDIHIAVEYDGSFFHKDKPEKDEEKHQFLRDQGFDVIRVREEPLECGELDVSVEYGREKLTKTTMDQVVMLIRELRPSFSEAIDRYLAAEIFVADDEFNRIASYLPGPPEGETLADVYPHLADEWNFEKNAPLTPDMFHPSSGKKVWWICEKGHEWDTNIYHRGHRKTGCPYCSNKKLGYGNSLAEMYPQIAALWYQPANGERTPENTMAGSGYRAWWQCENGHISRAGVAHKVKKNNCLHCPGVGRNRKYTPPDPSEWEAN